MKIKLSKTNDEVRSRPGGAHYCFVDPKSRKWNVAPTGGDCEARWELQVPEDYIAGHFNVHRRTLKELCTELSSLLEVEAEQNRNTAEAVMLRARVNSITEDLERFVQEGKEVRATFSDKLTYEGALCHEVSWARGLYCDYLSKLAEHTLTVTEDSSLREAVEFHLQYHTKDLLRNKWCHNSTSAFAVAVNEIKREVTCDYVAKLQRWSGVLAEAAQQE